MRYLASDVGGTFTDMVLVDAIAGRVYKDKVPSTPGSADAVTNGITRLTATAGLRAADVSLFVHGFTVGTNAFLMRRGARTAMAVTAGFRDVLEIGDQIRPHLYRLVQQRPEPVVPRSRIVEVEERVDAFGAAVTPLSAAECERVAAALAALEPEAVAICLLFSHLAPAHERMLEAAVRARLPQVPVYISSRVNPQIEEFPRANTTAVAAYVGPVIDRYISGLDRMLGNVGLGGPLLLMRSDGGVATPSTARENPAHMLLSGPAGGVIAGCELASRLDVKNLITFDMGGTSADFSLIENGRPRSVPGRLVDGQPLRLPMLDIETISAGGGSLAWVDPGGALRIGPESAGAVPGPACYGQGGRQATLTDAAVVLGILEPARYLGGDMPLDQALAREAVQREVAAPLGCSLVEAALGVFTVANAQMVQAIRRLSVERGHDPRRFSLCACGGAGGIYAAWLARELGMAEVLVPRHPGVFAAEGLLLCDIRHAAQSPWPGTLARVDRHALGERLRELQAELDLALVRDGVAAENRYFAFSADLRCVGQFHELEVPLPAPDGEAWWDPGSVAASFHLRHEQSYGHADPKVPIELVNIRATGFGRMPRLTVDDDESAAGAPLRANDMRPVCLDGDGAFRDTPVYERETLRSGHCFDGPALVVQRDATVVLLAGQHARVTDGGVLRIVQDTLENRR